LLQLHGSVYGSVYVVDLTRSVNYSPIDRSRFM